MAHAYLFTGPRGTGKTSTARLLAKALCCEKGPTSEPCNECDICQSITAGNCMDVYEMDAASESGVDQVREVIVEVAEYRPTLARYKVFIIDEVHDLSPKAFDALLKTVEEPPSHVIFILATTEFNKVPPTIRSRCQKFEFHRGTLADLVRRLEYVAREENLDAEPAALAAIARMADGGYRDALTLLEQAMVTAEGKMTLKHVYDQLGLIPEELVDSMLTAIRECDPPTIMRKMEEAWRLGRDPRSVLESMEYRLGDLTRAAYGVELGSADATREASLHETATRIGKDSLLAMRSGIAEAHRSIREISLPRLWLEAELIRLARQIAAPAPPAPAKLPAEPKPQPRPTPSVKAPEPRVAASEIPTAPAPKIEAPKKEEATNGSASAKEPPDLWRQVRHSLNGLSKSLAMKLEASKGNAEGTVLFVEFEREFEHDWVMDNPKKQAAILEQLRALAGPDWDLRFSVAQKKTTNPSEPEAVELPAEGQRLEQLAKDILGAS